MIFIRSKYIRITSILLVFLFVITQFNFKQNGFSENKNLLCWNISDVLLNTQVTSLVSIKVHNNLVQEKNPITSFGFYNNADTFSLLKFTDHKKIYNGGYSTTLRIKTFLTVFFSTST